MLVVVLSHYGEVGTVKRAYEQGAHSFLSKPFKLQDLYNLMKYYKGYWEYANPLPADALLPHPSQELSGGNPQDFEIIT
jgi:DNA-binding NtrC family response regulator